MKSNYFIINYSVLKRQESNRHLPPDIGWFKVLVRNVYVVC